ncbi:MULTISPECIES: hypothetical protein [unclassified Glutamicibacter]|uniref:hypothetical protein n=1 Tax=unclassified Glutamicibacter TaxID=2627139 RepID=UPI0038038432
MSLPPILTNKPLPTDDQFWIDAATSAVRRYCGWHVTPVHSETLIVDGNGGEVLQLKSKHVVSVETVLVDGSPVDTDWSEAGLLARSDGGCWPAKYRSISVTLTHGYESAGELGALIAGIASRAAMNPSGNVVSQRAGTQSVTYAASGGAVASIPLLATEMALLDTYKLNWGP